MSEHTEYPNPAARMVAEAVATLPAQEREVLRHLYGLEGREASDINALAARMGLTEDRVRSIHDAALKQLRGDGSEALGEAAHEGMDPGTAWH